jgi:hypothetical protein
MLKTKMSLQWESVTRSLSFWVSRFGSILKLYSNHKDVIEFINSGAKKQEKSMSAMKKIYTNIYFKKFDVAS